MKRFLQRRRLVREMRNEMESLWLRAYFRSEHDIDVGLYSYGCFDARRMARGMVIGRFCSFAPTCHFLNGNHGLTFLSLHPYLYNTALGIVQKETISRTRFVVEDDVWIGHNAIVLPGVKRIGRGAVIAAGAVVTKDVRPYEIVGGNPARHIRMRFDAECIAQIEATRWWEGSRADLARLIAHSPSLAYSPADYFAERVSGTARIQEHLEVIAS
uniref:CatB-related O-acetyltransferase n=1 Tax=Niveibacterium sp. SC-1 TaxID=3135646 RepID=UPI004053CEA7